MHDLTILNDIALSIIVAAVCAHILKQLKQPLILAYVLGGIILGPSLGLGVIHSQNNVEIISEMGLIFLLFIIGLEINIKHLLSLGKNIAILSLSQFFLGAVLTAGALILLPVMGLKNNFDLLYCAIAFNLSSTLIVVKLLKDKFETETLAGRLTIGILVLQDIWAIIFMAFQPNFLNPKISSLLYSLFFGILLVFLSFSISKYILSYLFKKVSKTPELLLLSAIAWCFAVAAIAEKMGLSKEMGALIAGVSIASFPYGADVISKISGIRDFFVTLFFVALGLKFPKLSPSLLYFSIISLPLVIIVRFLSIMPLNKTLKLGARPSFITALNLSQISEFSLVIAALGFSYSHIDKEIQMKLLSAMLFCALVSSYLITYNDKIFSFFSFAFPKTGLKNQPEDPLPESRVEILVLGYFKEAKELLEIIRQKEPQMLEKTAIADFNEHNAAEIQKINSKWFYSDLANAESFEHIKNLSPKITICSISDMFLKGTDNLKLLKDIKKIFPYSKCIFIAENSSQAEKLLNSGADAAVEIHKKSAEELFFHIEKNLV